MLLRAAAARLLPCGRAAAAAAGAAIRRAAAPLPLPPLRRPRCAAASSYLPSLYLSRRSCIVASLSTTGTDVAVAVASDVVEAPPPEEAPAAEPASSASAFHLPEEAASGASEDDRKIYRIFKEGWGLKEDWSAALARVFPPLPGGSPSPVYVVARCLAVFGNRDKNGNWHMARHDLGASHAHRLLILPSLQRSAAQRAQPLPSLTPLPTGEYAIAVKRALAMAKFRPGKILKMQEVQRYLKPGRGKNARAVLDMAALQAMAGGVVILPPSVPKKQKQIDEEFEEDLDFEQLEQLYGEATDSDDGEVPDSDGDGERHDVRDHFVLSVDERWRPRYQRLRANEGGGSCGDECDEGAREPPPSPEGPSSEDEGPRSLQTIADADVRSLLAVLPPALASQLAPHIAAAAAPLEVALDAGRRAALRFGDGSVVRLPPAATVEECLTSLAAGRRGAAASAGDAPLPFRSDGRLALPQTLHRVSAMQVPGEAGGAKCVAGLTLRVGRHVDGTAEALLDVLAANTRPLRNRGRGRGAGGGIDDALALMDAVTGGPRAGAAAAPRSLLLLGPPGSGKTTLLRCAARHLLCLCMILRSCALPPRQQLFSRRRLPNSFSRSFAGTSPASAPPSWASRPSSSIRRMRSRATTRCRTPASATAAA
jgi:hypothetical protein